MASLADKYGVNAQAGEVTNIDADTFKAARLGAIRLRTGEHSALTVQIYRDMGAFFFNGVIIAPNTGTVPRTPAQFVAETLHGMRTLLDAGVGSFEIGYQPNTALGGYGLSWNSAGEFSNWYREVAQRFRAALPDKWMRFGFPVLALGSPRFDADPLAGNRPRQPVGDLEFLEANRSVINETDYLACATYWNSTDNMRDLNGGMRFLRHYHERFPSKNIVIAEFSNNRGDKVNLPPQDPAWRVVGDEYAEFYTLCAQYEWIEATFCQILHDPNRPHESWISADNQRRRIFEGVVARPRLPERDQLNLGWPTQFTRVTQSYGLRQLDYANFSDGVLRGGHEGIDLAAPTGSDIYASLPGTVSYSGSTQGRFGGYGAYGEAIVVESDVAGVGRVTSIYAHMQRRLVATGQTVTARQRIGLANETGNAQGSHLHFSLRIAGVSMRVQNDYLNPGLYLDIGPDNTPAPARGAPRMQYGRTYVLLPPNAGLEWVEAIIRATWDTNRYTIGGSADDSGIGDLDQRRAIVINPADWSDNLQTWLATHYAGTDYSPINAHNPSALESVLRVLQLPSIPASGAGSNRGQPRLQYKRAYILLPPRHGSDWALAAARATWNRFRTTIGGSADDAGIGNLDQRQVVAINPTQWGGGDLNQWYQLNYPGVQYTPIIAISPLHLEQQLSALTL